MAALLPMAMPAMLVVPVPVPLTPRAADTEVLLLLADPLLLVLLLLLLELVLPVVLPEEAEPAPELVAALEVDGPALSLLLRRFPLTGNGS